MNGGNATVWFLVRCAPLVALAIYPIWADTFGLQLVTKCLIWAIFAMSLNLLVGFAGLVSFGHAAFYGIGAYTLMVLASNFAAINFLISFPIALSVSGLAALAVGILVLRSSGIYFIMATLAFAQMFYYFVARSKALGGSDGAYVHVKPTLNLLGLFSVNLADSLQFYFLCLVLTATTFVLLAAIAASLFGRVLLAIRENEHRALALGFPTFRFKLAAFVIAGMLASIAGYLDAAQFGFVAPELFSWHQSGTVLMMVILGGLGTLYGPVLGAFAFTLLQHYLADLTQHWLLPMGILIIAVALALPRGLAGLARQRSSAR